MVCLLQFGMIKGLPGRVPPVPAQRSQWEHNVVSNPPNEVLSTFSHRRHRKMTAIVSNRTTAKGGNRWDIHHCRFSNQNNEKRIRFVSHATHRKAKKNQRILTRDGQNFVTVRASTLDEWARDLKADNSTNDRNTLVHGGCILADIETMRRFRAIESERVPRWRKAFEKITISFKLAKSSLLGGGHC